MGYFAGFTTAELLKALPTDEEITAAKARSAASYLAELELSDVEAHRKLVIERGRDFGAAPQSWGQPIHKCMEHVYSILLRNVNEDADEFREVSAVEMARFMQRAFKNSEDRTNKE